MNYTKKLLTSILTLVLMFIALGTGVYAWFTVNTKTTADSLTGEAETLDGGFLISTTGDKNDWHTSISLSDVVTEGFRFTDVTTTDGIKITDMEGIELNDGYLEFDLYFLTGSERKDIYLTYLEIEDKTPGASWVAETDIEYGANETLHQGTVMEANLSSALRVSFQDKDKTEANIFEKYGSSSNIDVLVDDNTATFKNTTGFGGFAAKYYEAIMNDSLTIPNDREDIVLNEDDTTDTKIATATDTATDHGFDDSFTHMTKVTVRVWLEGWDGEAFNAIHSGQVNLTFNFNVRNND